MSIEKQNKILNRIDKVLALAHNNSNDKEAEIALLTAQSMMAKYNIKQSDLPYAKKTLLKKIITSHTSKSAWKLNLAALIAKNFRCKSFLSKVTATHFYNLGFIGFGEDVEIAVDTYEFALNSLNRGWNRFRVNTMDLCNKNDFASGYTMGLKAKFDEQVEVNNWALVVQPPKEVLDFAKNMNSYKYKSRSSISVQSLSFSSGYVEGKRFRYKASKKLVDRK